MLLLSYQTTDVKIYCMACLLSPQSILRIESRLNSPNGLQIPYMAFVTKSYCVEAGRLSADIDISLKDEFQTCIGKLKKFFYHERTTL